MTLELQAVGGTINQLQRGSPSLCCSQDGIRCRDGEGEKTLIEFAVQQSQTMTAEASDETENCGAALDPWPSPKGVR
ncbi:unnamed protein product [Clonostachys byssicola]|uniref:Uncharacterized protein n=1 Tax=Clonostachys byssicola TaxID=160290 RepID=A0A9N9XWI4_9HYPO|nr:unnamed protein product [Clonostachys byssicola]